MGPILNGFGIVLLGDGFWASLNRSALTGITLLNRLSKVRAPMKTFARLTDAGDWVGERMTGEFAKQDLFDS